MVERLFLAVPRGCLRFVIVVFPDHTHLLFTCNVWKVHMNLMKVYILIVFAMLLFNHISFTCILY